MDKLVETRRERFWNPEAGARDQWVLQHATALPPGSRVLDAGAGASKYRPYFHHCRYETQDFCQYQGDLVRYTEPIDHVCEITRIPLPDASLDCILCTEVLEHVVDPMAVLREFRRLLKPGAMLLLTAPQSSALHMEPYHYYGGFTHYWYRHWLPEMGFQIDSLTPQGGPGRVAVHGLVEFYGHWRQWEQALPTLKRWLSRSVRLLCWKVPVHYAVPLTARWFDRRMRCESCVMGFMVAARRVA